MSVISNLLPNIDSILAVRDEIGAAIQPVFLCTKTWSGNAIGKGTATVTTEQILPSPRIVQFRGDEKIIEGGYVKAGDIVLKMISKNKYPTVDLLDCVSEAKNVERYYEVGGIKYQCLGVTEKHVTWNVMLRRRSNQG